MTNPWFLFFDCETTGLDPKTQCIIEVSARVYNSDLVLIQNRHYLAKPSIPVEHMEPFAREMHWESGLLKQALAEGQPVRAVEQSLVDLVMSCMPGEKGSRYLAGNSIHFDRSFLAVHMPSVLPLLSHRMLDVSSVRLFLWQVTGADPLTFEKQRYHTSEQDLDETLRELQLYEDAVANRRERS